MRDAEMLVWAGDFNYRIEATYEDAMDHIRNNDLDYLVERVGFQVLLAAPSDCGPVTGRHCRINTLDGTLHFTYIA